MKQRTNSIVTYLTVAGAFLAFVAAAVQLRIQNTDLKNFQQAFQDISSLKRALQKPLEGVWDYRVEYSNYMGEDQAENLGGKIMSGKAIWVWEESGTSSGYDVYVGAGVFNKESGQYPIVTAVLELKMATDSSGIPNEPISISGKYVARTSASEKYLHPSNYHHFEYKRGTINRSTRGRITLLNFLYTSSKGTVANVYFSRK